MNLYQQLGYLVLGSRLRRISETFLAEVTQAYQQEGIGFEASWFPVFYLLSERSELSIRELSDRLEISHPAASQLVSGLKNKGLVASSPSKIDGRMQLITLTVKGRSVLGRVKPVWSAIISAMEELAGEHPGCDTLLPAIGAFESALQSSPLSARISSKLNVSLAAAHE
jgi:DNA-binding MarR family transcriptional regulator